MPRKLLILLSLALLVAALPAQDTKENADFKLALNLYNDGFYDLALEQFRQFISFYPNTQQGIEARYYLGLSQFALKRFDESRLTFQNFALSYPDHPRAPEAWQKIGDSYIEEGNKRDAALAFERIRTFHPRSRLAPEALERAAGLFDEIGDSDNAIRLYRVLTQEYASSGRYGAHLRLAELYAARDQYDAASTEVRKVIDGTQEARYRGPALYLQAQLLLQRGRSADARAALSDVRKNYRGSSAYYDALFTLGDLSYREGDVRSAVTLWKEITDDPRADASLRQRSFFRRGGAGEATMDLAAAFTAYDSARSIPGGLAASSAYRAARIRESQGDTAAAARLYEAAARDTASPDDRLNRLIGAVRGGAWLHDVDLVARYARQIQTDYPDDEVVPKVLLLWAEEERDTRHDAKAAEDLYASVLRDPNGAAVKDRAMLGLARSQAAAGYPDRAVVTYDDLVRTYPATPLRSTALNERDRIQTYSLKDRDAGTEQLALLLGDVIGEQSASTLAFRLAEISFLQLKNFTSAATQYRRSLDGGLITENRPMAWLHLGQSLLNIAHAPGQNQSVADRSLGDATAAFETVLREHPEHPLASEALIRLAGIICDRASEAAELTSFAARVDSVRPDGTTASRVWDRLARRAEALGVRDKAVEWYGKAYTSARADVDKGEILWRVGDLLARTGAIDTAITLLDRSFSEYGVHPSIAKAGERVAGLRSLRGDVEAVRNVVDRLTTAYPYAVDATRLHVYVADAEYVAGRMKEALTGYKAYVAAMEADPFSTGSISTSVLYRMAQSARQTGDNTLALRLFGEVIGRSPEPDMLLESWYAVAGLSEKSGDLPRASAAMEEASRIAGAAGGDVTAVSLQSAELQFRNEQYQDALAKYQKVQRETKSDSLRTALDARIVVCYYRLNNPAEGDKRANAFVRNNPKAKAEAAEFEFERGTYHARQGRIPQARERFEIIVRDYPNDARVPEAMSWLGRLYEIDQQPDSAAMVYESLLQKYPNADIVPRVELSLGNDYYALEQWDKASELYRRIVDHRDRAPDLVQYAMNNLILTYKELTLFDGALQLTREYISLYPDDPELINKRIDIGVLYQKLGYYDQSVVHLQDLLLTAPSEFESELRYYIGEAYFYKGDYQQAILEFLKVPYLVVRQGPIDWIATSYYMAGQSYEKLSRFEQAIAMYQQIIDRRGIDAQFKTAAQREIERVKAVIGQRK